MHPICENSVHDTRLVAMHFVQHGCWIVVSARFKLQRITSRFVPFCWACEHLKRLLVPGCANLFFEVVFSSCYFDFFFLSLIACFTQLMAAARKRSHAPPCALYFCRCGRGQRP